MNDRIRHIDGLRGVAVLGVVLYHCGLHDAALLQAKSPVTFLLRQGCHGVDLFFVLSGFCLSYPVLARLRASERAPFNIAAYAARRIVRIVPPYYAAILAFAAFGAVLLVLRVPLPGSMAREALSAGGIIQQLLFLDRERAFLNGSFWTLAIEFRWYFVFPVVLWLWIRFPKTFCALAVMAVIAAGATRAENNDVFFLPFFMLGIVAAQLHADELKLPGWAFAAGAAAIAAACLTTAGAGWRYAEGGPFWGIAMFAVVAIVGATPILRKIASSPWIVRVGVASYGIYLIHEPAAALIQRSAAPVVGLTGAFVLAFASALTLGFAFSFVAERPFLKSRLRDRIIAKVESEAAAMLAHLTVPGILEFHRGARRQSAELAT